MAPGYVCIAGIDPSSGLHVRPVARTGRLRRADIEVGGRELTIGTEVDLGSVTAVPNPPEVEDHEFNPAAMKRVRELTDVDLVAMLESTARSSLSGVFGSSIEADGNTASVPPGSRGPSLGCLQAKVLPRLEVMYDKVKLVLEDGGRSLMVAVTDLRLYEADQKTPSRAEIDRINAAIASGRGLLSVGLSRPFTKPGDSRLRHWLQINNVHVFS